MSRFALELRINGERRDVYLSIGTDRWLVDDLEALLASLTEAKRVIDAVPPVIPVDFIIQSGSR